MCRGKLIRKHEDHAFWVESILFSHLNPLGLLYAKYVRPLNGRVFGVVGRAIYDVLAWWRADPSKV